MPKRVCQTTFSGQLLNFDHSQKISISKNVLSSFILDGDCYVAESNGTDFLGYVRITINPKLEDPYYEDTYSISNKENLMIRTSNVDCFSGVRTTFDALNNHKGKYYAKGKLIKVCQYCQKPDCSGECQILCPKCLQPIFKCYCGRACICYAERFLEHRINVVDCDSRRDFGNVGIPFWDSNGNLIVKKKSTGTDERTILNNLILDAHGIELFYIRLGQNPPASPKEIITNIAKVTEFYEKIQDGRNQQILKRFNNLYSAYSAGNAINEAMDNQDFIKAFYEEVKCIPAVGSVMGSIEQLFTFMYSETFNNAMYKRADNDLKSLDNCLTDYCNKERPATARLLSCGNQAKKVKFAL